MYMNGRGTLCHGADVILPDLILPSRVNQRRLYSGIDSPKNCDDKQHFQNYPYTVDYVFNSRGFRDHEWPDTLHALRQAIWCLGDSFTVGLGQPYTHIWPQVLATAIGRRCINISMDGASNDWIWRKARDIWTAIQPTNMVIMWSYTHRRELPAASLSDEARVLHAIDASDEQDLAHWTDLVNKVHKMDRDIVQCVIPQFHPDPNAKLQIIWQAVKGQDWPRCPRILAEFESLPEWIVVELKNLHSCYSNLKRLLLPPHCADAESSLQDIIYITNRLDWARDHHHFDILTSQWVVDQIMLRLNA